MNKTRCIALILVAVLICAFGTTAGTTKKSRFTLAPMATTFATGSTIRMVFSSESPHAEPQLFVIHSYGRTLLDAKHEGRNCIFTLPESYSRKSGAVSWYLLNGNQTVDSGVFQIISNVHTKTVIENYLGPRRILAGGKEFTMMVTVPTDAFDNPKEDHTPVRLHYQFLQEIRNRTLETKDFVAWYDIYSPTQSGKLLVATECTATVSKEIETEVYPNIGTDFTIAYARNHEFADGNQITRFSTSLIRDTFGNTVSDGTLVTFIIKTRRDMVLKTFGTTINGIATAQILHPDHPDRYRVKGYITGIAESNTLDIGYKPVAPSFHYSFSNHNRTITVGPIKSYMNQLVPDGIKVTLQVCDEKNREIASLQEETSRGIASFILGDALCDDRYHLNITTLGMTQITPNLHCDNQ